MFCFLKIYLLFSFLIYVEMKFTSAATFTAAMESFIKVFRHYSVICSYFESGFWQKFCVRMIGQHLCLHKLFRFSSRYQYSGSGIRCLLSFRRYSGYNEVGGAGEGGLGRGMAEGEGGEGD